jgi:hypothetical protein
MNCKFKSRLLVIIILQVIGSEALANDPESALDAISIRALIAQHQEVVRQRNVMEKAGKSGANLGSDPSAYSSSPVLRSISVNTSEVKRLLDEVKPKFYEKSEIGPRGSLIITLNDGLHTYTKIIPGSNSINATLVPGGKPRLSIVSKVDHLNDYSPLSFSLDINLETHESFYNFGQVKADGNWAGLERNFVLEDKGQFSNETHPRYDRLVKRAAARYFKNGNLPFGHENVLKTTSQEVQTQTYHEPRGIPDLEFIEPPSVAPMLAR